MKKTYHIVTRAARETAAIIEQFCQTNGQILLPIVNLIQNASQVVESVIHELGHQMLEHASADRCSGTTCFPCDVLLCPATMQAALGSREAE